MSERYTRLFRLPENLYLEGAPVLVAAGALLKDNQNDNVLVQLKIQNLNGCQLTACKVSIRAFDPSGAEVRGVESHSYLDLSVNRGGDFGTKTPIHMPDDTTRSFEVAVTQAVFADGTVWQEDAKEWKSVTQTPIADRFDNPELQKQYSIEIGGNCANVPEIKDGLFLCACGAVNLGTDDKCWSCGREAKALLSALDMGTLENDKNIRLEKEEQARIEKGRKAGKRKKVASLCTVVVVIAVCAYFLTVKWIIPNKKYNDAIALKDSGNYAEASAIFEELNDFKNSEALFLESKYNNAVVLMNNANYKKAFTIFKELGDYQSSKDYCLYCEIKAINFDDGNSHSLVGLLSKKDNISDSTLREKIESIPQIQTLSLLNGSWKAWDSSVDLSGDHMELTYTITDGEFELFGIYYFYYGSPPLTNEAKGKLFYRNGEYRMKHNIESMDNISVIKDLSEYSFYASNLRFRRMSRS